MVCKIIINVSPIQKPLLFLGLKNKEASDIPILPQKKECINKGVSFEFLFLAIKKPYILDNTIATYGK